MIIFGILLCLVGLLAVACFTVFPKDSELRVGAGFLSAAALIVGAALSLWSCILTVPAGHEAAPTLFGKVQPEPVGEGFHFVNPFMEFTTYDMRDQTYYETASVPSQDKLTTAFDLSLQWRLAAGHSPDVLQNIGTMQQVLDKHIIPKFRSAIREEAKGVQRADEFFLDTVQSTLQTDIEAALIEYLEPRGVLVMDVLIRDVRLPSVLVAAVEAKKDREVKVEQQQAELDRFRIEQQQKVEQAQAQLEAAQLEAQQIEVLADARAFEINAINAAIQSNPAYIQLEALKALQAISSSDSSKIYFLNGDSPHPLPLMLMGDELKTRGQ